MDVTFELVIYVKSSDLRRIRRFLSELGRDDFAEATNPYDEPSSERLVTLSLYDELKKSLEVVQRAVSQNFEFKTEIREYSSLLWQEAWESEYSGFDTDLFSIRSVEDNPDTTESISEDSIELDQTITSGSGEKLETNEKISRRKTDPEKTTKRDKGKSKFKAKNSENSKNPITSEAKSNDLHSTAFSEDAIYQKHGSSKDIPMLDKAHTLSKIMIRAGKAFGAGDHATTKATLLLMEKTLSPPTSENEAFLDVGCGTGIFAIWAYKYGFRTIVATDIDEEAIDASHYNRRLNNAQFDIYQDPLPPPGQYKVIVANILPPALNMLFDVFKERLAENGILFLAGFNESNISDIETDWIKAGFLEVSQKKERGWIAVALKHRM